MNSLVDVLCSYVPPFRIMPVNILISGIITNYEFHLHLKSDASGLD